MCEGSQKAHSYAFIVYEFPKRPRLTIVKLLEMVVVYVSALMGVIIISAHCIWETTQAVADTHGRKDCLHEQFWR